MDQGTTRSRRTVLVMYTELAPYVLACLNAFVEQAKVDIHLVRWPVNAEAPFDLDFHPAITVYDRSTLNDGQLLALASRISPALVITSGWVDKGYLRVCRSLRSQGVPTVMILDTAWRGTPKQWLSAALGRLWIPRTFSHTWATGQLQAHYASRLGFPEQRVRTGFYAADTETYTRAFPGARQERAAKYPHHFICVARYIPTKGQQVLCDAFAQLCDADQAGDWELQLVGVGEQFDRVRQSASGRHPRIKHLGFVQAGEMPAHLEQAGVSVLPSLYEPWGVVVQEHACIGLPLLLSDAVGSAERFLVDNGDRHRAGDVADLKRSLRTMIDRSDEELLLLGDRSAALGAAWTPQHWALQASELLEATA
ncbi:MAG TPA: glycosyltransferase family 4 protein [Flavobacteriales bacterium]|nr:glycosyltransferase family 4 protein [Flavobacteriales bacterium]HQY00757.1 glycosyltransferase family 4 protein [Flavobacteriales bacterium]